MRCLAGVILLGVDDGVVGFMLCGFHGLHFGIDFGLSLASPG